MSCYGYATGFHLFHFWSAYDPPAPLKEAGYETTKPIIAQRRECRRCAAIDYRRITVHD